MTKAFDTALALIQAEMTGQQVAEIIAERIEVKVQSTPKLATYIDRRANVVLPVILFDKAGEGTLKELVAKSSEKDYKLVITADGSELYNNDWDWFKSNSQVVKEFAAFQENSIYILSVTDIKFTKSLKVLLKPATIRTLPEGVLRLSELFLKVDIVKEV